MSRIGKLPVHLPAKVTVEVLPGNVVGNSARKLTLTSL